jgi:hypothetical protein
MIDDLLNERERSYGSFATLAPMIQQIKAIYDASPSWPALTPVQREVLEMDIVKTCRILNGDPSLLDNWADKAGYAMLAHEELVEAAKPKPAMPPPPVIRPATLPYEELNSLVNNVDKSL